MYRDLSSYLYSRRSLTWLKTVSIGVYGSYCIDLVRRDFPVRNNQILDEHEEGACELSSGTVSNGCGVCLSVCRSGHRYPIAYSLLGGVVPYPEHRLKWSLDSVPIF